MEIASVDGTAPEAAAAVANGPSPVAFDHRSEAPVTQAFGLGWNISRLFVSGTPPAQKRRRKTPDRLPSPGSLTEGERSLIRLGQVRAAIEHLDGRLAGSGAGGPLQEATSEQIVALLPADDGAADCEDPRASLLDAHIAIGQALSCGDAVLSKAYHLGVSLAATCYAPSGPKSLVKEFDSHRTAQIGEWLADLTSLFPDHSCRAVRLSCGTWRRWVEESKGRLAPAAETAGAGAIRRVRARAAAPKPALDPEEEWIEVRRALARQGEVWRALLSGEKPGTAMLELRDYVAAAARALGNGVGLIRRLWPALVVALILLGLGTLLVVAIQGPGAKLVGLASFAGAVGITWKGIGGGVGTVATRLQEPVWGAALDEEIAAAITTLPAGAKPAPVKARDAAPASGPSPSDLALHLEVEENDEWAP